MYTDNTMLTYGKYRFVSLSQVPASYLLKIYTTDNKTDLELYAYVCYNIERIKARPQVPFIKKPLPSRCNKISYCSEKEAKFHLKQIAEREQDHRKPTRAYECSTCGGWHLTAIPYEKWDANLRPTGVIKRIQHHHDIHAAEEKKTRRFVKEADRQSVVGKTIGEEKPKK